jgi:manganese efflux pump family protein
LQCPGLHPGKLIAASCGGGEVTETRMNGAAIVALAFAMSADSFAASLGKGAALDHPKFSEAVRTGLVFGLIEGVTPVLGWAAGMAAATWVAQVDHWVAFVMLALLGGHMAWKSFGKDRNQVAPARHSLVVLAVTAFATSLDAFAVGITLAFINVNIVTAASAIGLATFLMATIGTLASRWMAPVFGRSAELLGGICLIVIGVKILIEHTLGA